jgi:hypothetical protein
MKTTPGSTKSFLSDTMGALNLTPSQKEPISNAKANQNPRKKFVHCSFCSFCFQRTNLRRHFMRRHPTANYK